MGNDELFSTLTVKLIESERGAHDDIADPGGSVADPGDSACPANLDAAEESLECRICKEEGGEGEGGERMLHPCSCGGSMAGVHLKCLQHWIEQRRLDTSEASLRCEVCRSHYKLRIREGKGRLYQFRD